MRVCKLKKFGNGVMVAVQTDEGKEASIFLADDGSAVYRTVVQVCEHAEVAKFQKIGNGVMFDAGDGYFIQADDSGHFKDLAGIYEQATANVKGDPYVEPDDVTEEVRGHASSWSNFDLDMDDDEAESIGGTVKTLIGSTARKVNAVPGAAKFLGNIITGFSSMEEKRRKMKEAEKRGKR